MDALLSRHQAVVALVISVAVFALVLELVRRRRLREEYSWLWLLTGVSMIVLVAWPRALLALTRLIGAVTPVTTLFLFSLLFLLAIAVHYSVIMSRLTTQVKNLSQELALLESRLERQAERPAS